MIDDEFRDRLNPFMEERIRTIRKELEKKNEVKICDQYLVHIPQIDGKTMLWKKGGCTYVVYIYKRWYNAEKKQTRNRKTIIGQPFDLIPGTMVANAKYYQYFDRVTGKLREPEHERKEEREETEAWLAQLAKDIEDTEDDEEGGNGPGRESGSGMGNDPGSERGDGTGNDSDSENGDGTGNDAGNGDEEKEETDEMGLRMTEAIRDALAQEGMVPKPEGQWTRDEAARSEWEEAETDEEDHEARENRKRRKRIQILLDILTSIRKIIRVQAHKRPEDIVNIFQARKINRVLEEIQALARDRGLEDLMELITEPYEVVRDGKTEEEGMSYSDAEVILEYYNSIIWFIQGEIKK